MSLSSIPKHASSTFPAGARTALGAEIRRRRVARGLTQAELARPLTRAYVCAVERGHATPSLATLLHFSRRLGVPIGELLAGVHEHLEPH